VDSAAAELEPDFDTGGTDPGHEVDDQPLAMDECARGGRGEAPARGRIDFNLDGVVTQGEERESLVFANMDTTPNEPTNRRARRAGRDDPDDPGGAPGARRALDRSGRAGTGRRGARPGDEPVSRQRGNLPQAADLVDEILRLDPNSVRHRQKQVEFAFKWATRRADRRLRRAGATRCCGGDLPDKARSVYKRVAEHDPANRAGQGGTCDARARVATPPPGRGEAESEAPGHGGKTAARDAKLKVRDEAGGERVIS